jgi:predicted transcriptional regulator of viral defense system
MVATNWILDRLDPVLHEQDGYVTRAQAALVDVSAQKLQRLVDAGILRRVRWGIYALEKLAPAARVDERTYASWLALDAGRLPWQRHEPVVVVSHQTAAHMHSLGTIIDDGPVALTTPIKTKRTTLPGIELHRVGLDLEDWRWERGHRIMATTPARTMVDLAVLGIERGYLMRAAKDVVRDVGIEELRRTFDRHPNRTIARLGWLRTWLEEQA